MGGKRNSHHEFCKRQKIEDLKADVAKVKDTKKVSDVVSGATFADTAGYLQAIYDAATTGMVAEGIQTTDNTITEGQVLAAPHGTQSFGIVTVAMQGDKIANVFLDEFQYMPSKDFGGVPNSNADFGKGSQIWHRVSFKAGQFRSLFSNYEVKRQGNPDLAKTQMRLMNLLKERRLLNWKQLLVI